MNVARRLQQMEALAFERTLAAVRQEVEAAVQRRESLPGYAELIEELWELVEASDVVPPASWRDDVTTRVVVTSLEAWREEEGMPETTPERSEEWRTTLYRWRVVSETPQGQDIQRQINALIEDCAVGKHHQ